MTESPDIRWKQRRTNLLRALQQLQDALTVRQPDILQKQGTIQCFEYTFELAWKTLHDFMQERSGYDHLRGPRPVLEQAFQDGVIADGVVWLDMLKSRNLTSHLYDEAEVETIYRKIVGDYATHLAALGRFFEAQS